MSTDTEAHGEGAVPDAAAVLVDIESLNIPYQLLAPVHDQSGRIVDFTYRALNQAALVDYRLSREQMIGARFRDLEPLTGDGIMFDDFVRVMQTGQPLRIEDKEYPDAPPSGETLFFDINVARVGDLLGVSWLDVTHRYRKDREVARAERETRAVVDSMLDPLGVFEGVHDARGRVSDLRGLRFNDACVRYFGRPRGELETSSVLTLFRGEAIETLVAWCRHVLTTGRAVVLDEVALIMPNGRRRQFDIRAVSIGHAVSVTFRDVTRRVQVAQEIAEATKRYRLVAENASEMVFQTGAQAMIEWVSPSVQWVLGWPPERVIGRRFSDFVHPDDLAGAMSAQKKLIASGSREGRLEVRMVTAAGSFRWMSVLGKAIMDEDGNLLGGVDAVRDIQDSKDAQARLVESEERFRRAMDDAAIGMAIVSPQGRYVRVNPAMADILQRTEEELLACTWQDLTHPEDLQSDQELADEVLRGDRDRYRLAKRYVAGNGAVIWADLSVSCVRDDSGHVLYYLSQIIDITDAVEARRALATSEEHYRLIAENSLDVVFRASPTGRILWISPSVTQALGYQPSEVVGSPILKFLRSDGLAEVSLDPRSRERVEFEGQVLQADGSHRWVDITSQPVLDDQGVVVSRVGRLRDIAAKKRAEEALRRSEQLFRTAMESAPTGMAVIGLDRRFRQVNAALCQLLGQTEDWLLEHTMGDVTDPVGDGIDRQLRDDVLAGRASSITGDHEMIRADGQRVLVEHSVGLLRDSAGQPSGFVSQFADVTEARRVRDQLRFMATHDSLTELLNRRELLVQVSGILSQKPRTGENVGVLFVDLDNLKRINDNYGHGVGDEVIVTVAQRIRSRLRAADVVARFGGDEFVVVLPAVHSAENVERIATVLHEAVREPIAAGDVLVHASLSIGGVIVPPGSDPDEVLRRADEALYRAKREGRDRTVMSDG